MANARANRRYGVQTQPDFVMGGADKGNIAASDIESPDAIAAFKADASAFHQKHLDDEISGLTPAQRKGNDKASNDAWRKAFNRASAKTDDDLKARAKAIVEGNTGGR